ncbi:MAG: transcription-repair coupling factor [Lachnospiraceae bacterium]|nr:transcription-repair coupling factor [Lachnospiraceae bacterium]
MRALNAPLGQSEDFKALQKAFAKQGAALCASGCIPVQKLHLLDALSGDYPYRLLVTHSDAQAKELLNDLLFFDRTATFFPAKDLIFYKADVHGNELIRERMKTVRRILEKKRVTVVTTFAALMAPQVSLSTIKKHVLHLDKKIPMEEHAIAELLTKMGYLRVYQVEDKGQFAVRGDIIDVFDLTEDNPYRIELWGDEITSIRSFDILSQRSVERLDAIDIYPATEMLLSRRRLEDGFSKMEKEWTARVKELRDAFHTEEAHRLKVRMEELKEAVFELDADANLEGFLHYFYPARASFLDLFPEEQTAVFLDEPLRMEEQGRFVYEEFVESILHRAQNGYALPGEQHLLFTVEESAHSLARFRTLQLRGLLSGKEETLFVPEKEVALHAQSIAPYNNSFDALIRDLKHYRKEHYRILLLCGSRSRAKRLTQDVTDAGVSAFYSEDPGRELSADEVMTYYGQISRGFAYPELKFAVISESDIFTGREKKRRKKKFKGDGEKITSFADLKVGDYVVHEDHGLGIYQGIEQITVDHVIKDYMKVSYRDGGNLFVPVAGLNVLQKYASADASHKMKLNKLGSAEWTKTKAKVESAVEEIAQDLIALYAKRQSAKGFVFSPDTVWQKEFEEAFPFDETTDQLTAIEAVKGDMESEKIMDRLVCGDVGFGKTEVAIRAAFKALQDNKQVAVLVPTTILAQQHYNTFVRRFKNFPVKIDMLSRFRTQGEQRRTVEGLKKGSVDIVIGTHRLLSKDVAYKDLGLLVVDEEQRFGISHKEKIKKLKDTVDVLTLTATPIPRTLHMSLVGIRDMSLLREPPLDRQPIQTFVSEYNEELVREAILREVGRGGQVYYVYNRVNTIADVAASISKLVPEAHVAFAHGQMQEAELERIMYEFIDGTIDVLISTTIIETGLDIPNVNTMIVHDSDQMGLAQLYQLRGRVGRSSRTAYAFLLYRRNRLLREVAEKRLTAIREFTDLGSGYKIAMRDLEIRGAGNLLGRKQSGHMAAVGYDLYCKMLNDAITRMKNNGEEVKESFTTFVDLDIDAFIPSEYILNEEQKLEIYQRIALLSNAAEAEDMLEELLDRFGPAPLPVQNLIRIALLRGRANAFDVTEIKQQGMLLVFKMKVDARIDPAGIPALVQDYDGALLLRTRTIPQFELLLEQKDADVLAKSEQLIAAFEERLMPH